MKIIYVAGPYRGKNAWEIENNIRMAEEMAHEIWMNGAAALCPHSLCRFFHGAGPEELYGDGCMEMLRRCDAMFVCMGWDKSEGTKAEIEEAEARGIPYFHHLDDLIQWLIKEDPQC